MSSDTSRICIPSDALDLSRLEFLGFETVDQIELENADLNQDGFVEYDEINFTELKIPILGILKTDSASSWKKLVLACNTLFQMPYGHSQYSQSQIDFNFHTLNWIENSPYNPDLQLYRSHSNEHRILDVQESEFGIHILATNPNLSHHENHLITIHISKIQNEKIIFEMGGNEFDETQWLALENDDLKNLARDVVFACIEMHHYQMYRFGDFDIDQLEATFLRFNHETPRPIPNVRPQTEVAQQAVVAIQTTIKANANPVRFHLTAGENATCIPVRSEFDEIEAPLIEKLQAALNEIPMALFELMEKLGSFENLSIELSTLAYVNFAAGRPAGAVFLRDQNKFVIPIESLRVMSHSRLTELILHELCHGLMTSQNPIFSYPKALGLMSAADPMTPATELSTDLFWIFLYVEQQAKINVGQSNSFNSIYAQTNVYEFLAESGVGYFTGDHDPHEYSVLCGQNSRSELKRKLPLLYAAFRLYLEPESPFFGDRSVFSQTSYRILQTLVQGPKASILLTSADTVENWVSAYKKAAVLDFNLHQVTQPRFVFTHIIEN